MPTDQNDLTFSSKMNPNNNQLVNQNSLWLLTAKIKLDPGTETQAGRDQSEDSAEAAAAVASCSGVLCRCGQSLVKNLRPVHPSGERSVTKMQNFFCQY